jgi:hypothetical protein
MIVFHSTSRAADKTNKIQISEKIRRSEEDQKNVQISETFLTFQKIWPPCLPPSGKLDDDLNLYVSDAGNHRVQKFYRY